jgi:hypothetical protein
MNGREQVQRLGERLIGLACRLLPEARRNERYNEWTAEFESILDDPEAQNAALLRAFDALAYATDTIRGVLLIRLNRSDRSAPSEYLPTLETAAIRRPGRPPVCPPETARRILQLRTVGYSLRLIAETLNEQGIPTPLGLSPWTKSHVNRILHTRYVRELGTATDTEPAWQPPPEDSASEASENGA